MPIVPIYGRKEVSFILEESGAAAYLSPVSYGHVDYGEIVQTAAPDSLRLHVVVGEGGDVPRRRRPAPNGAGPGAVGRMLGAVLGPLATGEAIHLIDRWDPGHALEVMRKAGIAGGTGASVFLQGLLDHADFTAEHARLIDRVGLGGAPVPVALEGVELRLVDEEGAAVPPGRPGVILSRGPDLCLGYTDPALTAAAFDDDDWYRTGDVGVLDEDGYLAITERRTGDAG